MSKKKNKNNTQNQSALGVFVERKLPSDNQVKRFDKYLKGGMDKATIGESLSEIYETESGQRANVSEMEIKPKRNLFTKIGVILIYILACAALAGGIYYWVVNRGSDTTAVGFTISAPTSLVANEEFEYTINYQNQESVSLKNIELVASYPENFIFESSSPQTSEGNNKWSLQDLRQFGSGQITIKGRLIAPSGSSNIMFADLSYEPSNISSTFKKSASFESVLASSGIDMTVSAPTSILVGQQADLSIKYKPQDKNFLNNFIIHFGDLPGLEFPKTDYGKDLTMTDPGVFSVASLGPDEKQLDIKFILSDKNSDSEDLKVSFEYKPDGSDKSYSFEDKTFPLEVVKNSLNLTLVANGQSSDQGADFGQTINYSISYINKGDQPMSDVIIMAVLDGEALDWRKIVDTNNGKISGNTIVWTKDEIPELKTISKGQEGTIDFSIPIRPVKESSLIKNFEVKNYAQFAVGGNTGDLIATNEINRSNQMTIKVNSDVSLDEAVRYFDQDNIAVGTGPLPPQAGQTTTVKVYWKITNALHELGGLQVTTKLPNYISWDAKDQTSVGTLSYDQATNQVTWTIGRLPISASSAQAEFSIALKPKVTDRNKILILVSGTNLSGVDNETTFPFSQILQAQTTRLEKDDIADKNGIVQ